MLEKLLVELKQLGLKINSKKIMDQLLIVNPGADSYIVNLSFIANFTAGDYQTINMSVPVSQDQLNKIRPD